MAISKKKNSTSKEAIRQRTVILGSFLILISFILFISFTSYLLTWEADQSALESFSNRDIQTQNALSKIGAWLGHLFIFNLFGYLNQPTNLALNALNFVYIKIVLSN